MNRRRCAAPRLCLFSTRPLKSALWGNWVHAPPGGDGDLVIDVGSMLDPAAGWRPLTSQSGSDRVQVDQHAGPGGLQFGFWGAVVTASAGVVAVDHQAEQPLDAWSSAREVVAFGGLGELAQRGLTELFAAVDADLASAAGEAALAQRTGVAVGE